MDLSIDGLNKANLKKMGVAELEHLLLSTYVSEGFWELVKAEYEKREWRMRGAD